MPTEYRVIAVTDLSPLALLLEPFKGLLYTDSLAAVIRFEDGLPVEFIGCDGAEPEDQTLLRDWSWIAPALTRAYDLGWQRGGKEGYEAGYQEGLCGD